MALLGLRGNWRESSDHDRMDLAQPLPDLGRGVGLLTSALWPHHHQRCTKGLNGLSLWKKAVPDWGG